MKKIFGVIIVLILIIGIFAYRFISGKSKQNVPPEGPKKVKVVLVQGIEDIDFLIDYAQDKGYFAKNNIEVERIYSDKEIAKILIAGEADILVGKNAGSLSAYYGGAETRLLANTFYPFTFFTMSRFSREEAGKIKKAAVISKVPDALLTMNNALKNFGADPEKVEIVTVPSDSARELMLAKGEIDFTITNSEKFFNSIDAEKKYHVMLPSESLKGLSVFRSIVTTKKSLKEKPAEIRNFVFATYEALENMSANHDEVLSYLQTKYKLSKERSEKFYGNFVLSRKNVNYVPDTDSLKNLADASKKELNIDTNGRSLNDFIYADFAKDAVNSSVK